MRCGRSVTIVIVGRKASKFNQGIAQTVSVLVLGILGLALLSATILAGSRVNVFSLARERVDGDKDSFGVVTQRCLTDQECQNYCLSKFKCAKGKKNLFRCVEKFCVRVPALNSSADLEN